ncbi:hypothetical protein L1887_37847 [Cichorium endivia]|nr:hypothetical protein L1887_37847 [Cichorium endivia]
MCMVMQMQMGVLFDQHYISSMCMVRLMLVIFISCRDEKYNPETSYTPVPYLIPGFVNYGHSQTLHCPLGDEHVNLPLFQPFIHSVLANLPIPAALSIIKLKFLISSSTSSAWFSKSTIKSLSLAPLLSSLLSCM